MVIQQNMHSACKNFLLLIGIITVKGSLCILSLAVVDFFPQNVYVNLFPLAMKYIRDNNFILKICIIPSSSSKVSSAWF